MASRQVAEGFSPGEFLKDEIEARGWSQVDLAEILGRNARLVSEIINGKRSVTPETAVGLADAFGTSAQLWMNLESAWQLSKLKVQDNAVSRRARLYDRYPVKEMIRRGWIEGSSSLDVLEGRFARFFEVSSIGSPVQCAAAFRRSNVDDLPSGAQLAWLFRAKQIAKNLQVRKFSDATLASCMERLRACLSEPEEIRHVPRILSEAGVRFVLIEPLAGSKVDGVCFWLNKSSPVVALSLRYDRIDYFWFTLIHEMMHVANKDGRSDGKFIVDEEVMDASSETLPPHEVKANAEAAEYLVPSSEYLNFVARVKPLYSEERVRGFARRLGVHPGVVVGRLQKQGEISYANLRKHLVKMREHLVGAAVSDGWGSVPTITCED